MITDEAGANFYIGWDVGAWHCGTGSKSCDGLVILDEALKICDTHWRGNLRDTINDAQTSRDWIEALFELCGVVPPLDRARLTLAIDAPLGFADDFVALVSERRAVDALPNRERCNPYLFRGTERFLFDCGFSPSSAVTQRIGSQATKGMHALAKFAPHVAACGVWTDGAGLTAIETYPSPCLGSDRVQRLRSAYPPLGHQDKEDALTCALVAYLFAKDRSLLRGPDDDVSCAEGWIWLPCDALREDSS